MRIAGVGHAFPPHYYGQEELLAAFRQQWSERYFNLERIESLHRNVLVGGRHLALPIAEYPHLAGFGAANDAWIRVATEVGAEALSNALASAGLAPGDLDTLIFVTVTGVATPSIDARLINRLRMSPRIASVFFKPWDVNPNPSTTCGWFTAQTLSTLKLYLLITYTRANLPK